MKLMKKRIGLLVGMFATAFLLSVVPVSAQQPEPTLKPASRSGRSGLAVAPYLASPIGASLAHCPSK